MAHANFSMICEVVTFLGHPSCRLWLSYARYQYLLLERHSTVRQWWLESSIIHAPPWIRGRSCLQSVRMERSHLSCQDASLRPTETRLCAFVWANTHTIYMRGSWVGYAMVLRGIVACNYCMQHAAIIAGLECLRLLQCVACNYCVQQLRVKPRHNRLNFRAYRPNQLGLR